MTGTARPPWNLKHVTNEIFLIISWGLVEEEKNFIEVVILMLNSFGDFYKILHLFTC